MSIPSTRRIILTLFTSKSCSLCVDAKHAIKQVQKRVPFDFEQKDIKAPENSNWFEKYKYDIPVLHLNNQFIFKHRIEQNELEETLRKFKETGIVDYRK
ncbi:thioredoxin-like protein [Glomus cerebriforme]|uniref:Glutaredoxin-like protein n=1 Tax=Glomus cerebriforme TaxID=658196 RepID=A0A397SNQ6_9GLOM|nr:thioredoxin-like protein [Glomus cerebriforme]